MPDGMPENLDDTLRAQMEFLNAHTERQAKMDSEHLSLMEEAALSILAGLARKRESTPSAGEVNMDIQLAFFYAERFTSKLNEKRIERGEYPCQSN